MTIPSSANKIKIYDRGVVGEATRIVRRVPAHLPARRHDGSQSQQRRPLLVEIDHFIECSTSGRRPRTDGAFRSEGGPSAGRRCQEFPKRTATSANPGGNWKRGLMTATTAVQSGRSYMAHSLALVESNEIGEDTRHLGFRPRNERCAHWRLWWQLLRIRVSTSESVGS